MTSFEFLGPYRIGESLGRGGMGAVYAAVHEKSGQRVAVKLIAQHVADEPRFRRRFDAEVKSLQRLRHDGIVRLIGFGEESGRLFYSMELVDGESLQRRIRREKKLDWRPTIDIAIQICAALKHAHDIGVIHRDLKPANLLLTPDDTVKLVDFGIAKIFGDGEQTLAGAVLGTADFMAPEQADSSGITPRTDLYALGSVMYAMLTGRPPFTGKSITQVIDSLRRNRPVPLDLVDPDLPPDLVALVHQLLEKNPQDRPPTALAVMNRLKSMRAGLQREQTVLSAGMPTEVGSHPLSSDSDTNVNEENISSAVTGVAPRAAAGPPRSSVFSKAGDAARVSPADPTIDSGIGRTKSPEYDTSDEFEAADSSKTHFQTVDASLPGESLFHSESNTPENHWLNVVALVATIAVAIACVAWFIQATRPPDAEQAYAMIVENGELQMMEDFLRRFPDEPRYQDVYDRRMETQTSRTLRRLGVQAKLGVAPLDAFEQGFVDAMQDRIQDPQRASERLSLWLDVHNDSTQSLDEARQEMIAVADHQRRQLAKAKPVVIVDPKAQDLIRRIRTGIEKAPIEENRRMLEGILSLHKDEPWAKPALDEAKSQLQALNEFSEPDE
jgi:serine/threonine protein kinase